MLTLWLALAIAGMSAPIQAQPAGQEPAITAEGFVTPGGAMSKPPRPSRPTVGLVLSGGGAKGIAHIGMIQALEDAGIPIDYITGTSMGAIVGGLYAAGYSPAEMIDLIASKGFGYWSTGKIDPDDMYYFTSRRDTPSFVTLNIGKDSTQITSVLPVSLINPIPMNYAFFELFSPYTLQCGGDFNRLFVPYRCVTSNVYAKHKVVLGRGPLGDAVRMSMSFPMIFEPIELNGVPMYDGGIYDNYPVDVMMEEFAPDAVIGVNVGSGKTKPDSRNMMDQLEEMIMQPDNYPFPSDKGISIRINLDEFGLLAFDKYKAIYDIGYKRGLEMMDSIKSKISVRTQPGAVRQARQRFKSATPQVRIDSVSVSGGKPVENAYLQSFFEHRRETPTLDLTQGRDAYYRAATAVGVQNFVPTPRFNVRDSVVDIDFKAIIKDPFTVGVGGYISSSTNSMLFFNTGYNKLSFRTLRANVNAWLGQSYMAASGDFAFMFNSTRPSAMVARIVSSRQKYHETEKLFYQIHEPDFVVKSESFAQLFYSMAPALRSQLTAGAGFGHLTDKFHARLLGDGLMSGRNTGLSDLGELFASWELNTLDNQLNPTSGIDLRTGVLGAIGQYRYKSKEDPAYSYRHHLKWMQLSVSVADYIGVSKNVSLGILGNVLLSTRKLLPTYDASIVAAEAFHPTPSSYNYFNTKLRANSYVAAGVAPVWKISGSFQLRGSFHCFMPLRKIVYDNGRAAYGKWLHDPEFFGELQAVIALPFGSISAYGNYTPAHDNNWNFGISIGAFILAPRFLR